MPAHNRELPPPLPLGPPRPPRTGTREHAGRGGGQRERRRRSHDPPGAGHDAGSVSARRLDAPLLHPPRTQDLQHGPLGGREPSGFRRAARAPLAALLPRPPRLPHLPPTCRGPGPQGAPRDPAPSCVRRRVPRQHRPPDAPAEAAPGVCRAALSDRNKGRDPPAARAPDPERGRGGAALRAQRGDSAVLWVRAGPRVLRGALPGAGGV
mmetsp:Transcript_43686/g.103815  ORF Transcript_43686/g.103815 Transcript_43686/m.103815 type:complete len:209 (+) Transcript_43686:1942-2568(+)